MAYCRWPIKLLFVQRNTKWKTMGFIFVSNVIAAYFIIFFFGEQMNYSIKKEQSVPKRATNKLIILNMAKEATELRRKVHNESGRTIWNTSKFDGHNDEKNRFTSKFDSIQNRTVEVNHSGKLKELRPNRIGIVNKIDVSNENTYLESENNSRKIPYSDCADARFMSRYTYNEYTAVVSAQGSGNTWVRYLIERATGVLTGSFYHDPKLYKGGFRGELENPLFRNTIAIKTHHPFQRKDIKFRNAVVIVRDPFDVVIAERNRIISDNGHTSVVSESFFKGTEWIKFAEGHSTYWEHSCRECITIPNHLIVYYSDLKINIERELRRILQFLNVTMNEKRLACVLSHPDGQFKRLKKSEMFYPFTKELTELINGHIRNVSALFRANDIPNPPFSERTVDGTPVT